VAIVGKGHLRMNRPGPDGVGLMPGPECRAGNRDQISSVGSIDPGAGFA